MLENSRASNSRAFVGVLSKFPKLKTSIFRIAGQPFDKSYPLFEQLVPELALFRAYFELPPITREKQL